MSKTSEIGLKDAPAPRAIDANKVDRLLLAQICLPLPRVDQIKGGRPEDFVHESCHTNVIAFQLVES